MTTKEARKNRARGVETYQVRVSHSPKEHVLQGTDLIGLGSKFRGSIANANCSRKPHRSQSVMKNLVVWHRSRQPVQLRAIQVLKSQRAVTA